ncbi:hypothetical protein SDC9_129950 [bioreactor metagenome]|uniref:Uncharacterized protein n=1 Tax=bioreactor metagenome TaxID=1076179 RepID=A0A645D194_9ZZZZ
MTGHNQVFLYFIEFCAINICNGVFFAVNNTLLQCAVKFAESDRCGGRANGVHGSHMNRSVHGSHFQALHIGRAMYFCLGARIVSKAVVPPGKADDPGGLQLLIEIFAHFSVIELPNLIIVCKAEGEVANHEFLCVRLQGSCGRSCQINASACFQCFNRRFLVA